MTEIEELIKQAEDTRGHKAEIREKLIQFHKEERVRLMAPSLISRDLALSGTP